MNDQLGFWPEEQHGLARHSDPVTSHMAAAKVNVKGLQQVAAEAHRKAGPRGMSAIELERETGIAHQTITPRLAPLIRKGILFNSGEKRPGPTGHAQRVLVHDIYRRPNGKS